MLKLNLQTQIGIKIARWSARQDPIPSERCIREAEKLSSERGVFLRFGKRVIASEEPRELTALVDSNRCSVQVLGSVIQAVARIPEISGKVDVRIICQQIQKEEQIIAEIKQEIDNLNDGDDTSAHSQLVELNLRLADANAALGDKREEGIAYMGAAKYQVMAARQEKDLKGYKTAMRYYYEARRLFREIEDKELLASAYSKAGGAQLEIAKKTDKLLDYRKAEGFNFEGARWSQGIGDRRNAAFCLDKASQAAWCLARYPKSEVLECSRRVIEYGQQAVELFESMENTEEVPYIYSRMGRAFINLKEFEKAIENLKRARNGFRDLRNKHRRKDKDLYKKFRQEEAYALSFMAKAYRGGGVGYLRKSISRGRESSRIFLEEIGGKKQAANDLIGVTTAQLRLSKQTGDEQDFKDSLESALEAMRLFREADVKQEEIAIALRWLVLAQYEYARQANDREVLIEAHQNAQEMVEIYKSAGDQNKLAYAYFDVGRTARAVAERSGEKERETMLGEAIEGYSRAIELLGERDERKKSEILISMGFCYFFRAELANGKEGYEKAVEVFEQALGLSNEKKHEFIERWIVKAKERIEEWK